MPDPATPPLPPRELVAYVRGGDIDEDWAQEFDAAGRDLKKVVVGALPDGLPPGGRVLDFGCGSGRLMRQLLEEAQATDVHGCDIDAASVDWVRDHLCPPCHVSVVPPAPPLEYADGWFDVVLAVSVFSQLADGWAGWLLELRRILRPGGLLVLTVMGPRCAPQVTGHTPDEDDIGMSVHGYGRPWRSGGPMILHAEWWLRAHYGRAFEIVSFVSQAAVAQDVLLLRRPATDVPAPTVGELCAPEPGEPRELRAALNDVERLHHEYAALNASHDAYATAYADESQRTEALLVELQLARDAPRARPRTWRRRA